MGTGRSRPGGWERVLRRLLPQRFRQGWSREILDAVRTEQSEAAARGRIALLRYRLRTMVDIAHAGWQMRPRSKAGWRFDLRLAWRSLRRSPGFVIAGVVTLGLGISVSAGMFSALEHTLVRPLPLRSPDELLQVRTLLPPDADRYGVSPVDFIALEQDAASLSDVTYYLPANLDLDVVLRTDAGGVRINALRVAPDYFETLGVEPTVGPGFDTSSTAAPEIMLSHAAWTERYGRAAEAVGDSLHVDGRPHEIVGVLPAGFDLPHGGVLPDYWISRPLLAGEENADNSMYFDVIARIAPGRTLAEARAEIGAIGSRSAAQRPGSLPGRRLTAVPLAETVTEGWTAPLTLLGFAALVVLLMACSSVALLMLARQCNRSREIAVWLALGARLGSVTRRLMAEVLIVATAGLALGLLLARWGAAALLALVPSTVPRFDGVTVDTGLLTFAVVALGVTTVGGGLAPLLQLRRVDPAVSLKGGTDTSADGSWTRSVIVALQSALMAAMLVAMGLALVSFARLRAVDPGFQHAARFAVDVTAPQVGYAPAADQLARETSFYTELRDRALALPGVRGAGIVSNLPLTTGWGGALYVEDALEPDTDAPVIDWEVAGPGYFEAAGIPIVRGRGFAPGDTAAAPYVVIINEALAERFFPDRDPIGITISGESNEGPWRRVVGIVGDVRQQGLDAPPNPQMYIAQAQAYPFGKYQLVLSAAAGAPPDAAAIRALVRAVDADGVAGPLQPLEQLVDASVAPMRLAMTLVGLFAALATLLALTGTWGVISLVGRSRAREWGMRSALGAARHQVVVAAVRAGGLPVAYGLAAGFAGATLGARWLAGHVYGLSPWEPGVVAAVLIALLLVTSVVVVLPAWRTSRVDPATVLRET